METRMQASTFKAQCLAVLDDVARTRTTVVVTKHGKAVARLVPVDEPDTTLGSVTLLTDEDDDFFGTGESWDAES
jgi:prevent-host-death family protein